VSKSISENLNVVALDCGNSSVRTVLGRFDGHRVTRELIDRFPNDMIRVGDLFYWDILNIFKQFLTSLKKAVAMTDRVHSVGVCSWGVDFALYDRRGHMLGNPLAYRNAMGASCLEALGPARREEMFFETGILCDKINSVFLLKSFLESHPEICAAADKILMIPDILNYMITGEMVNEPSELSTTQLFSVKDGRISDGMCEYAGVDASLFARIGEHGRAIGSLSGDILDAVGADYDIPVVCVPSHDTASAVLSIPAEGTDFAFISSGTWSLIGIESDRPMIGRDVMEASLTNELGAFGKTTLLKNCMGFYIIQRVREEYELAVGRKITWDDLTDAAEGYKGEIPLFDVNDTRFFNPKDMSGEIRRRLTETKQAEDPIGWDTLISSVYLSMACCYAVTLKEIETATGRKIGRVHIVSGGARNDVLNRLTANMTGKEVVAGDPEGTSLGNILCQLNYFDRAKDIGALRGVAARSIEKKTFIPDGADRGPALRYEALLGK
jgi:sugar (pentulose or hexulose) kinase